MNDNMQFDKPVHVLVVRYPLNPRTRRLDDMKADSKRLPGVVTQPEPPKPKP